MKSLFFLTRADILRIGNLKDYAHRLARTIFDDCQETTIHSWGGSNAWGPIKNSLAEDIGFWGVSVYGENMILGIEQEVPVGYGFLTGNVAFFLGDLGRQLKVIPPEEAECPVCLDSTFRVKNSPQESTCMAGFSYFDTNGRFHYHDPNRQTIELSCFHGHKWEQKFTQGEFPCWCHHQTDPDYPKDPTDWSKVQFYEAEPVCVINTRGVAKAIFNSES